MPNLKTILTLVTAAGLTSAGIVPPSGSEATASDVSSSDIQAFTHPDLQPLTATSFSRLTALGVDESLFANATAVEISSNALAPSVVYKCETSDASPYAPYVYEAAKVLRAKPDEFYCEQQKEVCTNMVHHNTAWLDVCGKKWLSVECKEVGTRYIDKFIPLCKKGDAVGGYIRYVFPHGEGHLDYNAYYKAAWPRVGA